MTDLDMIEAAMIALIAGNASDTKSLKHAQDKWLDALAERAEEYALQRKSPGYDGKEVTA